MLYAVMKHTEMYISSAVKATLRDNFLHVLSIEFQLDMHYAIMQSGRWDQALLYW